MDAIRCLQRTGSTKSTLSAVSFSSGTENASKLKIFDGTFLLFQRYNLRTPLILNPSPTLMATITKRELVIKITDQLGAKGLEITQQDVLEVVQTLIDEITDSLAHGDTVVMRNFGAFQVREMKAKIGRNPKDPGKDVPIPARAAVKFKPGKEMKEKVATTLHVIRERKS
jgi:DNA-binding protein HU-beta/integration host factor subunit alpha